MKFNWTDCGLCHEDDKAIHDYCGDSCDLCHFGESNHLCAPNFEYCENKKCRCCHTDVADDPAPNIPENHLDTECDCSSCHSSECDASEHLNNTHELDKNNYYYIGDLNNKGCDCCHGYPSQCICEMRHKITALTIRTAIRTSIDVRYVMILISNLRILIILM